MTFSPSNYQTAIYEDMAKSSANTVVRARAGTGKTTTIITGVERIPAHRKTLLCAFNKSIQKELADRAPPYCEVKTLHGAGFAAIRRRFPGVQVDENKGRDLAAKACIEAGLSYVDSRGNTKALHVGKVAKLVGLAKNLLATKVKDLESISVDFDIADDEELPPAKIAPIAAHAMDLAAEETARIDFDDMVWFPWKHQIEPRSHDVVIVDETQDMNASQLWLARALCRRNGRIIAVGDDRQAIYGWRGADANAMAKMIKELEATVLPLSITYRCPKSVVALAKQIVPDYEAAPSAPEGIVRGAFLPEMEATARPGDFVLSRTNAPLMRVCLWFLKRGVPACISGRDIGRTLVDLAEKAETDSIVEMSAFLSRYLDRERTRLIEMDREDKIAAIADKVEALQVLAEGETSVGTLRMKIENLFRDDDPRSKIVCSTVHKAKGLERDRVWMLTSTFRRGQNEAEDNIFYVAVTRARQELVLVDDKQQPVL